MFKKTNLTSLSRR